MSHSNINSNPTMYLEPKAGHAGTHQHHHDSEMGGGSDQGMSGGGPINRQISYNLSKEQFEQLYLQPGGVGGKGDLSKRFGNPTPLGIAGFLLSLTPVSIYLMGFGYTTTSSAVGIVGAFYMLGGVLSIIAGIMEWIIGNTFPFIVFTTFGGFWIVFAILNDPAVGILASYGNGNALEGSGNPVFASGFAVYLVCWGVLIFIYLLASLRTNVVFVLLFTVLDIGVIVLAAAYFRIAEGRDPSTLIIVSGAFNFATCVCGWYIMLAVTLGSTGMPFLIPLGDLSSFLSRKS